VILRRKIASGVIKDSDKIRLVCVCKCNHMIVCDIFNNTVICSDDTVQRQCATNRKVAGSISDGVTGNLH
jgi:hypothetical protein